MLNISALFFNISSMFIQTCPICQQASECPTQRMMLAAVQATDCTSVSDVNFCCEQTSYTKLVLLVS